MSRKFKLVFLLQDMDAPQPRPSIFDDDKRQMEIELRDEDVAAAELAISRQKSLDEMPQETDEEKRLWLEAFNERSKSRKFLSEVLLAMGDLLGRHCHIEIDKYLAKKKAETI